MRLFLTKFNNIIRPPVVVVLLVAVIFSGGCDTDNRYETALHSSVVTAGPRNFSMAPSSAPQSAQSLLPSATDSNITQRGIQPRSSAVIDKRLADLALGIAASTIKLTTEIQGTIDYEELSRGWSYTQILGYIYQGDAQLREIFAPLFVEISPASSGIIVRVYTRDRTAILIEDFSETSWIDWRYGQKQ